MTTNQWLAELANQRLTAFELRTLCQVAACGPITSVDLAIANGRRHTQSTKSDTASREWRALVALKGFGLVRLSGRGWVVTTNVLDQEHQ